MPTLRTSQALLLCLGLFVGCSGEPQTVETPIVEDASSPEADEPKRAKEPKPRKVFTDQELEEMASHQPREGMGMNFYYDELRKRNDAKWAKEELNRRRSDADNHNQPM